MLRALCVAKQLSQADPSVWVAVRRVKILVSLLSYQILHSRGSTHPYKQHTPQASSTTICPSLKSCPQLTHVFLGRSSSVRGSFWSYPGQKVAVLPSRRTTQRRCQGSSSKASSQDTSEGRTSLPTSDGLFFAGNDAAKVTAERYSRHCQQGVVLPNRKQVHARMDPEKQGKSHGSMGCCNVSSGTRVSFEVFWCIGVLIGSPFDGDDVAICGAATQDGRLKPQWIFVVWDHEDGVVGKAC